jgi:DNA-binding response OmpR family regulator
MDAVIAVISRNQEYADWVCELLADEGYQTIMWMEETTAYDMICREQPTLVLLDAWLEHPHAGEMVLALMHHAAATRNIPAIICTTDVRFIREKADILRDKRCEILPKPFELDDLLTKIRDLTASQQASK